MKVHYRYIKVNRKKYFLLRCIYSVSDKLLSVKLGHNFPNLSLSSIIFSYKLCAFIFLVKMLNTVFSSI